jgi:hypothetical protein
MSPLLAAQAESPLSLTICAATRAWMPFVASLPMLLKAMGSGTRAVFEIDPPYISPRMVWREFSLATLRQRDFASKPTFRT